MALCHVAVQKVETKEPGDRSMKRSLWFPHWLPGPARNTLTLISLAQSKKATRQKGPARGTLALSPGSDERHSHAGASLQSKYMTWLVPKPNRRPWPHRREFPIEGHDLTDASCSDKKCSGVNRRSNYWLIRLTKARVATALYYFQGKRGKSEIKP